MTDSPLSDASPSSLEELYSRSPFDLSDSEIDTITRSLRAARAQWKSIQASPGKPRRGPASPKAMLQAAPAGLSLGDLDLDI